MVSHSSIFSESHTTNDVAITLTQFPINVPRFSRLTFGKGLSECFESLPRFTVLLNISYISCKSNAIVAQNKC